MRVQRLTLRGVRNLVDLDLAFPGRLVVFHGANGQGKTNVLEALYYLANLKSFRPARRTEMIRHGAPRAHLAAVVASGGMTRRFEIHLDGGGRRVRVDGKDQRSLGSYFDSIRAVAFTPDDPVMVRGAPGARRAFLDRGVFLLRPDHLELARELSRVVSHKNALLRRTARSGGGDEQLTAWNRRLAEVGARVSARRDELVQTLAEPLRRVHRRLVPEQPVVEPAYRSAAPPGDVEALLERIEGRRDDEWARGQALVGPHRDDLRLRLDGRDLRRFGSQGQVRTAALALKLALLDAAATRSGDAPLFVLDDLGSELDPGRNEALLEILADLGEQVFVATTSLTHLPATVRPDLAIEVRDGHCAPAEPA